MSDTASGSRRRGVDVTGPEDASEIVFVHGTVLNRTMWAPQRDALAEEFRVVAPDLPGHGSRTDESFTMEEGVRTVERVVDDHTDGAATVVGLSLGGYVATEFARRRPDAVEDLVVADASANPVGLLGRLTRATGRIALLASRVDLVERATDWLATRYVESRDLRPEQKAEIVEAGFDLRPFGEAGLEIAGEDFRSAFAAFPGPALVVNGEFDRLMRRGEDAHAAAGDAGVVVIDGAGHASNLDEPHDFTVTVGRFAGTAPAGDATVPTARSHEG